MLMNGSRETICVLVSGSPQDLIFFSCLSVTSLPRAVWLFPLPPLLRRLTNLSEDHRLLRSGTARQIRRAGVESLVSQNGESKSFLGILRHAQLSRVDDFDTRERRLKLCHHQRIMRAAAGYDHLPDFCPRQDPPVESIHDGKRREHGSRAQQVGGVCAVPAPPGQQAAAIGLTVLFAAGTFGRPTPEVGIAEQLVEQLRKQAPAASDACIQVV